MNYENSPPYYQDQQYYWDHQQNCQYKKLTIYITALMKVVGIQAKDGRIEVAIDKEEAKRATEVNSRRQNGYGGLT